VRLFNCRFPCISPTFFYAKQKTGLVNAVAKVIPTPTILGLLARPSKVPYIFRTIPIPVRVAELAGMTHVIRKLPPDAFPRSHVAVWAIGASDLSNNATTTTTPIPSWATPV